MKARGLTRIVGRLSRTSLLLIVLLIVARALLPVVVLRYVNQVLSRIPDYRGHVADIDVALIRGAYSIHGFKLNKMEADVPVPFVSAEQIDLSVSWKDLFDGKVVGEVDAVNVELNFVRGDREANSQVSIDDEWLSVVKDLFPLRINRFVIRDAEIHYRDFHSSPQVDVAIYDARIEGTNFSNTRRPTTDEPARVKGQGMFEKVALVTVEAEIFPAKQDPTFDLEASLENLPLETVNDFFEAYGSFEAKGGRFDLFADFAAAENRFHGSVKPILKDIEIRKFERPNPIRLVWDGLVSILAGVLENRSEDQIATTIPFEGSFDDPESSAWETIIGLLRNAFIRPLSAGPNEEITLKGLEGEE